MRGARLERVEDFFFFEAMGSPETADQKNA
jgi:hypothetical protein